MPKCKLCGEEKKLLKSHIIPEFMYKPLYDGNSRFKCISTAPKIPTMPKQKGDWERLLCKECELHISKFEGYVSQLLHDGLNIGDAGKIEINNIDYKLFKLFQLSILWRASVSSRPMFTEINLGQHEEIIRKMLLNTDPGKSHDYGCIMLATMHKGKHINSLILQPEQVNDEGQVLYRFVFGGFWWLFYCETNKLDPKLLDVFLREEGFAYIFLKELGSAEHVIDFAIETTNRSDE